VIINNTLQDPHWKPVPGSPIRSWLGVPLRVREEAVGVLNINSHALNHFSADDSDFAQAFADQAGVAIQNARAHELQIQIYEAELETARAIQNSLLPQELPPMPQVQLTVRSVAARHVSGDFYQYYMLPDGRLGLAVGDVSGKGIPAALLMAVISTTLRDEILRQPSPADLLGELNERLLPRMQQNKMNSGLMISIFDPRTRHLEIACGGMLSPYVRRDSAWLEVELSGYPLGAAAGSSYSPKTITLAPESMVIFLTDGVIESQNATRELYGYDRFEALLAGLPPTADVDTVADTILEAVHQHLGEQEPQDDITILILKSL
jgi:phosphoserine phosphatase RsbU/P